MLPAAARGLGTLHALILHLPGNQIQADELIAGLGQGQGRLGFSHSDHVHLRLTQTHCQLGKIAVAGHKAEAVHLSGIENVHGVDHHGHVRRVFPNGIVKLLDGVDGIFQERILLPAVPLRPVPVDSPVGRISVVRNFIENAGRIFLTDVIRINQYGKMFLFFFVVHISLHFRFC